MNEFTTIIEDLVELFKELTEIEQIKIEAVKKNMVTYVEDWRIPQGRSKAGFGSCLALSPTMSVFFRIPTKVPGLCLK